MYIDVYTVFCDSQKSICFARAAEQSRRFVGFFPLTVTITTRGNRNSSSPLIRPPLWTVTGWGNDPRDLGLHPWRGSFSELSGSKDSSGIQGSNIDFGGAFAECVYTSEYVYVCIYTYMSTSLNS